MTWEVGDRVHWVPAQPASYDYGKVIAGVVADAPAWPPVDRLLADGERIPVDLDPPITIPEHKSTRPFTMTRLWVREMFLEPYRGAPDE